jgi:hypothetical protein
MVEPIKFDLIDKGRVGEGWDGQKNSGMNLPPSYPFVCTIVVLYPGLTSSLFHYTALGKFLFIWIHVAIHIINETM